MTPVEEIKSRLDIVEFIRGYVKLEKSGQNWRALCPFHAEKTPSFFVSPSRQSWHCFGACQTGGDIFSFLMKIENLEFPEALKILAEKAGVTIAREDPRLRSERNRLQDILERAARFYETNLASAEAPKRYLISERELREDTIKTFRLGWAPNEWRLLFDRLTEAGFRPEEIERAGLAVRKAGGGYFDRFRSRIMFPLCDGTGRVIGFTGRIFLPAGGQAAEESAEAAKYVNTPETPLFSKSKILYGLHRAKSAIAKENAALLVEGQMDFLAAWQEGIQNVIATSGTALTDSHLRSLRRLCDTLILGFDMDAAGETATERGVLLAAAHGFTIRILTLPEGKDIADFSRSRPGELAGLVAASTHLIEHYFNVLKRRYPLTDIAGKKRAIAYLLPRLKTLASPSERALWLRELSAAIGVREDALFEELQRTPSLLEANVAAESDKFAAAAPRKTRRELLAERALALALGAASKPPFLAEYVAYFPDRYRDTAQALIAGADAQSEVVNYLAMRADYERALQPDADFAEELALSLRELKREALKEKIGMISSALREAERLGDDASRENLSKEFVALTKELRSI
jgi:DNA primase